jgi:hypothetical protein
LIVWLRNLERKLKVRANNPLLFYYRLMEISQLFITC